MVRVFSNKEWDLSILVNGDLCAIMPCLEDHQVSEAAERFREFIPSTLDTVPGFDKMPEGLTYKQLLPLMEEVHVG